MRPLSLDAQLDKRGVTLPVDVLLWEEYFDDPEARAWQIKYCLYSSKADPKTGRRRTLGTFSTRVAAEKHARAVQIFK